MRKRYLHKSQTGLVGFLPILVLGVLTISIIMLSSYLSREGVSFDIREQAVYEQICPGSVSAYPSSCVVTEGATAPCQDIKISWDFPGCQNVTVDGTGVGIPGGPLAYGNSGSFFTDVYPPGADFYFYANAGSDQINHLRVNARHQSTSSPDGEIRVSPRPCQICSGGGLSATCTVRVEWSIWNAKKPRVMIKLAGLPKTEWDNKTTGVSEYELRNNTLFKYVWFGVYDGYTLLDSADSFIEYVGCNG